MGFFVGPFMTLGPLASCRKGCVYHSAACDNVRDNLHQPHLKAASDEIFCGAFQRGLDFSLLADTKDQPPLQSFVDHVRGLVG